MSGKCGWQRRRAGGGWLAVVIIGAAVAIAAKAGHAVASAGAAAGHVLAVVLEVVLITIASAAGVAVLAALGWAGLRVSRWRVARRVAVPPAVVRAEVIPPEREAIEPPEPRFDGIEDLLAADQVLVSRE